MIATAAPRAAAAEVSYEDGCSICFFGQREKRQVNSSEIDGNAQVVAESQQRKHDYGPAYNVGHGENVRLKLMGVRGA